MMQVLIHFWKELIVCVSGCWEWRINIHISPHIGMLLYNFLNFDKFWSMLRLQQNWLLSSIQWLYGLMFNKQLSLVPGGVLCPLRGLLYLTTFFSTPPVPDPTAVHFQCYKGYTGALLLFILFETFFLRTGMMNFWSGLKKCMVILKKWPCQETWCGIRGLQ